MKKIFAWLGVFIAIMSLFLLATSAALPVPSGVSGLNFANMQPIRYYTIGASTTYTEGGQDIVFEETVQRQYSVTYGYMDILPQMRTLGDKYELYFDVRNTDFNVFEYVREDQQYTASAIIFFQNRDTSTTHRKMTSEIVFTTESGKTYSLKPDEFTTGLPNNDKVVSFKMVWDLDNFTNGETDNLVSCFIQFFQILQQRTIDPNYLSGSETASGYVPYNEDYFYYYEGGQGGGYDPTKDYDAGFDDGYAQGAEDTSGGFIQRWGAFAYTAVEGFLSFELFPGFALWSLLAMAIAIPLVIAFLKMFVGG